MSRHATSSALRPITLQSVYDEIATVRELLERLLLPTTSPRQWLTIAEATALAGGRTPHYALGVADRTRLACVLLLAVPSALVKTTKTTRRRRNGALAPKTM
jgi:hypothetical protein